MEGLKRNKSLTELNLHGEENLRTNNSIRHQKGIKILIDNKLSEKARKNFGIELENNCFL